MFVVDHTMLSHSEHDLRVVSQHSWCNAMRFGTLQSYARTVTWLRKIFFLKMELELIETTCCPHLTMRALNDFIHNDVLYQVGNIPIYVFLGILDSTDDKTVMYASRACFTLLQSNYIRKRKSFHVDPNDDVIGFIAFKTTVGIDSDVVQFAKGEHWALKKKIHDARNNSLAAQALIQLNQVPL